MLPRRLLVPAILSVPLVLGGCSGSAETDLEEQGATEDALVGGSGTASAGARVETSGSCAVSYYETGKITANGESFNPDGMTAAHKKWKFGTRVRVTNLRNDKSVIVRINDRGPYVDGRCIDLARGAFRALLSPGERAIDVGVLEKSEVRYEIL